MARTVVAPLPHDLAVKTALEALSVPVGYGAAPPAALDDRGLPVADYLVLFRVGGQRVGTLADPFADGVLTYQTTAVGRLPDGVSWLLGRVESALLGVTIAGRSVIRVEPVAERGPEPDRDVGPPHPFFGWAQFHLVTVPA